MCKGKQRIGNDRYPAQMVTRTSFAVSMLVRQFELLTSDAVFETMQGKQSIMAV
jgi:hypothetical protein